MTTKYISDRAGYFVGLSTDPKPTIGVPVGTIPTGALYREIDTGNEFEFDGTDWVLTSSDNAGITQVSGGVGIRGWLSGIFSKLSGVLNVSFPSAQPVTINGSLTNIPVEVAASDIIVPIDKQAVYRSNAFIITAALAANASLSTAPIIDGIQFKRLTGRVFVDQSGTLKIYHSDDGTTWGSVPDRTIAVSANAPVTFDEPFYCRWVKIDYTNGASAQGSFSLSGYVSAE